MKRKLLYLSIGAYFLSLASLGAVSYKINGDDADTPKDVGNEMFTTASYYCQVDNGDGSGWVDIPLADRVLPSFETDAIKFDNINVTLTESITAYKFDGLYNTNLVISGADAGVTLTGGGIWADGFSTVSVLNGASLTVAADLCAFSAMSSIDIVGTSENKSSFNGAFSSVETVVNLDNAVWTNNSRDATVALNGKLTLSNTNWENTVGGLNLETTSDSSKFESEALLELKDGNVANLAGNIRLGSSNAGGGTATLLISGDNNELTATNLEGPVEGRTGGDAALKVTGNNNTIFINGGNVNIDGYVAAGSITGGSQGVDIQGEGNIFKATNRISIGRNDGSASYAGGSSYFKISSSSAENKAQLLLGGDVNLGLGDGETSTYTSEFTIGGNTVVRALDGVNAAGNINLGTGGHSTPTGGKAFFNVSGSNNDVFVTNVNVMHVQATGAASAQFKISGSNNIVHVGDSIRISSLSGGDGESISNGNGYVTVSGTGNTLLVDNYLIIGNHDRASSGLARFTVEGSGNTVTLNNVNLGAGTEVGGGNGRFVVNGSGNTIDINGNFNCWSPDAASSDPNMASGFEFVFDASGISTININGTSGIDGAYYFIDLSALLGIFYESTNGKFTLISSVNDFSFDSSKVDLTLREGDEDGCAGLMKELDENNNWVLNLYYSSSVPEPSTYALMFGVAALVFALSRRTKKN